MVHVRCYVRSRRQIEQRVDVLRDSRQVRRTDIGIWQRPHDFLGDGLANVLCIRLVSDRDFSIGFAWNALTPLLLSVSKGLYVKRDMHTRPCIPVGLIFLCVFPRGQNSSFSD
jgi:hypothetical protein